MTQTQDMINQMNEAFARHDAELRRTRTRVNYARQQDEIGQGIKKTLLQNGVNLSCDANGYFSEVVK